MLSTWLLEFFDPPALYKLVFM